MPPSLCLQDDPEGIDVCLTCFNGGCVFAERHHAYTHYKKIGHAFAINVERRRLRPTIEEREEDKYERVLALRHYRNAAATATAPDASSTISVPVDSIAQADQHVRALLDGIMRSMSSRR
ncbi:hypothetical protein F5888DRAFT_1803345 [Russula emetica]|nr:hypothetical protein F5888DRAFT_1803345 [Russula emetica]